MGTDCHRGTGNGRQRRPLHQPQPGGDPGGVDPLAKRHRRYHQATLESLMVRAEGLLENCLLDTLESKGTMDLAKLQAYCNLSAGEVRAVAGDLAAKKRVVMLGDNETSLLFSNPGRGARPVGYQPEICSGPDGTSGCPGGYPPLRRRANAQVRGFRRGIRVAVPCLAGDMAGAHGSRPHRRHY